jgi:hypothetical protein
LKRLIYDPDIIEELREYLSNFKNIGLCERKGSILYSDRKMTKMRKNRNIFDEKIHILQQNEDERI